MMMYDDVTGRTKSRELPYLYESQRKAYKAVDFFSSLGGEWEDHDNLHSHRIHVTYRVVPVYGEN